VKSGRDPDSCHPSFRRGPTVFGRINPGNGTDRLVNPDSVEPKVVLAGSIRQNGRSNTGIS
jgi:hypothetical protein